MTKPIRLVYVMGEGRSGSTMLDVILGNHPDVVAVGELWTFFTSDEQLTGPCSCGKRVQDCPFWSEVGRQFASLTKSKLRGRSAKIRAREDGFLTFLHNVLLPHRCPSLDYQLINLSLLRAIRAVAGDVVIVDSTKQVGRALNLLRMDDVDVTLVHLVRDGRAVWWSRQRDALRDDRVRRSRYRRSVVMNSIRWYVKNRSAALLRRQFPNRGVLVRYEDLVTKPSETIQGVLRSARLEETALDGLQRFPVSHSIGGNERTRTKSQAVQVTNDEEWKTRLSRWDRCLFDLVSGRLLRSLGYGQLVAGTGPEVTASSLINR